MKRLSMIARVITPAAMVVFLAYEMSRALSVSGWWYALLLIGAFCTAVGIEIVGILSGHALEGFWRVRDVWRSLLSLTLLLIYVGAAVWLLRANHTLVAIPIIAAIVYIVAALTDGLQAAISEQVQTTAVQSAYDIERRRADDEQRRKLQVAQMRLQHEAEMEAKRLAHDAKLARLAAKPAGSSQKSSSASARHYECACGRVFEGSRSYNAHRRHCKIEPAKVYENGKPGDRSER